MKTLFLFTSLIYLCSFNLPYSNKTLYLSININSGKELILDDNSKWEIDPADQTISSLWLSPFPLTISFSDSDEYPYILTNKLSQAQVKAKALGRS